MGMGMGLGLLQQQQQWEALTTAAAAAKERHDDVVEIIRQKEQQDVVVATTLKEEAVEMAQHKEAVVRDRMEEAECRTTKQTTEMTGQVDREDAAEVRRTQQQQPFLPSCHAMRVGMAINVVMGVGKGIGQPVALVLSLGESTV